MRIYSEPEFACLCNQVHNLTLGLHPKLGLPIPGVTCLRLVCEHTQIMVQLGVNCHGFAMQFCVYCEAIAVKSYIHYVLILVVL